MWWNMFSSHALNYSRPHLVEFIGSDDITISNLTFLNPPAWDIHPVYCRYNYKYNSLMHSLKLRLCVEILFFF